MSSDSLWAGRMWCCWSLEGVEWVDLWTSSLCSLLHILTGFEQRVCVCVCECVVYCTCGDGVNVTKRKNFHPLTNRKLLRLTDAFANFLAGRRKCCFAKTLLALNFCFFRRSFEFHSKRRTLWWPVKIVEPQIRRSIHSLCNHCKEETATDRVSCSVGGNQRVFVLFFCGKELVSWPRGQWV